MSDVKKNIAELIKEIATKAVDASNPVAYYYGTVLAVSPLQIKVSQNLILSEEFLVVPKSLTNYEISIYIDTSTENTKTNTKHTHLINYSDDTINGSTQKNVESEIGEFDNTHAHKLKGVKNITFYNALKVGEKVILARAQGGQEFIIIDKVG